MTTYFSTFIPGMGEFIAEQLKKDLASVEINLLLEGLVAYQSNSWVEEVKQLRYLNNSFQVLGKPISIDSGLHRNDKEIMESFVKEAISGGVSFIPAPGKSFRVMFYYANSPVAVDKRLHKEIEGRILDTARMTGKILTVDRTNPDFEYWFLFRQEGYGFFGLRLTKHPDYKDILAKGQLRPELTTIMVLLSNPQPDEVILDPFTGSGAIPIERAKLPCKKIIANELQTRHWNTKSLYYTGVLEYLGRKKSGITEVRTMNALDMKAIEDGSVDKIITDPPWGIFQKDLDITGFYNKFLGESARVLVPGGTMILLVGRNVGLEDILAYFTDKMVTQKRYDILVSGMKASIFVLVKNSHE